MERKNIDLSIVLACYNEMEHINKSLYKLVEYLDNTNISYELILIDDCSTDGTVQEIPKLAKKYPKIKWYLHKKNIGRGGTIAEGIKVAKGKMVGFIDIDLETPPWYILPVYIQIKNGYDIALAQRIYKFNIRKILRFITSRGYNILVRKLLEVPFLDTESGFKFFNKKKILPILEEIKDKRWFWDTEVIVRSYYKGYKIKEIPTLFKTDPNKTSTVNLFRDSIDYFKNLVKFRKEFKYFKKQNM